VVGIGINVTTDPHDLPETATSVTEAGAPGCDPYRLTGALCRHFQAWYDVWTGRGFVPIREALHPRMGHFGQPIHISAGASNFEGTASNLDEQGRLLVRLDSGIVRPFEMGEVTLLR
jgi:BirA family biotin operon repressor/biotin-[acetyl-CoA-carboxylase] ligase